MSTALYNALRNNQALSASVINEGREIAIKTVKETMVHIRRMDQTVQSHVHEGMKTSSVGNEKKTR